MLMLETIFDLGDVIYDASHSPMKKRTIEKIEILKDGTVNYLTKSDYQNDRYGINYSTIDPDCPYICRTEEEAVKYFLRGRK